MAKLFLVDDEPDILESSKKFFVRAGFEVFTAPDGKIALDLIPRMMPDIVVTDVTMPNINGYQLAKTLKSMPSTAKIPIIVLTAYPKTEDSLRFCGVDDFLVKPFGLELLQKVIEKTLVKASVVTLKPKLLVYVEDDLQAQSLGNLLSRDKTFQVEFAARVDEVLSKAVGGDPEIVLIDIFTHQVSSAELIKALRSFSKLRNTKIFTLLVPPRDFHDNTAFQVKMDELNVLVKHCQEAGATAYLGSYDASKFVQHFKSTLLTK